MSWPGSSTRASNAVTRGLTRARRGRLDSQGERTCDGSRGWAAGGRGSGAKGCGRLQELGKASERFSPEPPGGAPVTPRPGPVDAPWLRRPLSCRHDQRRKLSPLLRGWWPVGAVLRGWGASALSVALSSSAQSPSVPQQVFLGQPSIDSPVLAWAAGQMTPLPQHPAAAMRALRTTQRPH